MIKLSAQVRSLLIGEAKKESILLTIYVLPEIIGYGIGTAIINALEQDEYFLRAKRIEIPSSITAVMAETTVPEYRLDLCKGYTPFGFADKVFHLHIRHLGNWDEPYFCEYLNQHPEKAKEYADLEMKLQTQFKHNRDAYTEAKGEFIRTCVKAARRQN